LDNDGLGAFGELRNREALDDGTPRAKEIAATD
jgi:hypothetical protein